MLKLTVSPKDLTFIRDIRGPMGAWRLLCDLYKTFVKTPILVVLQDVVTLQILI
jgi:hypothetical protein